jgi:hypothetical protein
MEAIFNAVKDTPIPTIFVVAGIGFLLLALAGQVPGKIEVPASRQKWAGVLGSLFLMLGLALHVVPNYPASVSTATQTATSTLPPSSSESSAVLSEMKCNNVEDFSNQAVDWMLYSNAAPGEEGGNRFLRFTPPVDGAAEAWYDVNKPELAEYDAIRLRINTHGAALLGNDASALYLDQDDWKFVALAEYDVTQNDWQPITIPISAFEGFNKDATFVRFGFRFWTDTPNTTIDVDDIQFCN